MRRRAFLGLLATALAGCSKGRSAGAAGGRIVSISPSTTEAVFAIGAGSRLVGRSRYCNYPPEVVRLPEVGGYVDPNFEAILTLRPDLVVGARGPSGSAIADRLAARGIATYFPETESFAAIDTMLLGLGERTGLVEAAKGEVQRLHGQLELVNRAVANRPKPRVLLVFGISPLSVAGPASFADEMVRRAGGVNAVTEGGAYPTIGVETVLRLDPDLVIDAAMMEERNGTHLGKNLPGWDHVRAATTGRVKMLGNDALLRPGPRIGIGLQDLALAIHPESRDGDPEERRQ